MPSQLLFHLALYGVGSDVFGRHTIRVGCQVAWGTCVCFTLAFYSVPRENCGCQEKGESSTLRIRFFFKLRKLVQCNLFVYLNYSVITAEKATDICYLVLHFFFLTDISSVKL